MEQLSTRLALLTQSDLSRQSRSLGGVVGRYHRVVGTKVPFLAILLWRQSMRPQMTAQRLEFLPSSRQIK
jgi:hypothetical protein